MFAALLWKEWRQQRGVFAALLVLSVVVLAAGWQMSVFCAFAGAALIGCAGIPVLLGANAFTGEYGTRTSAFLSALPIRPGTVFTAKFLTAVLLCIPTPLLLVGTVALLPRSANVFALDQPAHALTMALAISISALAGAALVGATCRNGIGTVLGTIVLAGAGYRWHGVLYSVVQRYQMNWPPPWWVRWGHPALALAVAVGLAYCVYRGGGTASAWRRLLRLVGACAVFAIATACPLLFLLARFCLLLAPSDYVESGCGQVHVHPDPTGKRLAVVCELRSRSRVAFVDSDTGAWSWFTRYPHSCFYPVTEDVWQRLQVGLWSPDGRRCLLPGSDAMAMLREPPRILARVIRGPVRDETWMFNADDGGKSEQITHLFPPLPWPQDWLDNSTVFCHGRRGVFFRNLDSGREVFCMGEIAGAAHASHFPVAGKGVFVLRTEKASGAGTQRAMVLRFHPDLSAPEATVLDRAWVGRPSLADVSSDGRWCLVTESGEKLAWFRWWLFGVEDGALREVVPPDGVSAEPGAGFRPVGFLPDSSSVLFTVPRGVASHDVATGDWRILPLTDAPIAGSFDERPGQRHTISPRGDRVMIALTPLRKAAPVQVAVVDLATGESRLVWQPGDSFPQMHLPPGGPWPDLAPRDLWCTANWAGDEKIVVTTNSAVWLMNRDGTNKRRLLPAE